MSATAVHPLAHSATPFRNSARGRIAFLDTLHAFPRARESANRLGDIVCAVETIRRLVRAKATALDCSSGAWEDAAQRLCLRLHLVDKRAVILTEEDARRYLFTCVRHALDDLHREQARDLRLVPLLDEHESPGDAHDRSGAPIHLLVPPDHSAFELGVSFDAVCRRHLDALRRRDAQTVDEHGRWCDFHRAALSADLPFWDLVRDGNPDAHREKGRMEKAVSRFRDDLVAFARKLGPIEHRVVLEVLFRVAPTLRPN